MHFRKRKNGSGPKDESPLKKVNTIYYTNAQYVNPNIPKGLEKHLFVKENIDKNSYDVTQVIPKVKFENYGGIEFGGKKKTIKTRKNKTNIRKIKRKKSNRKK